MGFQWAIGKQQAAQRQAQRAELQAQYHEALASMEEYTTVGDRLVTPREMLAVLAALLLLLIGMLLSPLTAAARPLTASATCDAVLIDGAHVFGPKEAQVTNAAKLLVNSGADVRVRTITTYGTYGTLDDYEAATQSQCPSWQALDGGRKNNLIVIMMSLKDRKTGIYYGDQWSDALATAWPSIQVQQMNPRFRGGDYAGGFAAGLQAIRTAVTAPQPRQSPSNPADSSWIGWSVIALIGACLLLALLFLGSRLLARREQLRNAQQKAQRLYQQLSDQVLARQTHLGELQPLLQAVVVAVDQPTAADLNRGFDQLQGLAESVNLAFGALPPDAGRRARAYDDTIEAAQHALADAARAGELTSALARAIATLQDLIVTLPARIGAMPEALAAGTAAVDAVMQTGYRTNEQTAALERASRNTTAAGEACRGKHFTHAAELLQQAQTELQQAVTDAHALPARRKKIGETLQALRDHVTATELSALPAAHAAFDQIRATYAVACWQAVQENESTAQQHVATAKETLDQGQTLSSMESQQWHEAEAAVAQATALLQKADACVYDITALQTRLAKAAENAAYSIANAQSLAQRTEAYILQYRDDLPDDMVRRLTAATITVQTAQRGLATDKPDVLQVLADALGACNAIDAVLHDAHTRHEDMEQQRARAAEARQRQTTAYNSVLIANVNSTSWGGSTDIGSSSGGGGSTDIGSSMGGGGSTSW